MAVPVRSDHGLCPFQTCPPYRSQIPRLPLKRIAFTISTSRPRSRSAYSYSVTVRFPGQRTQESKHNMSPRWVSQCGIRGSPPCSASVSDFWDLRFAVHPLLHPFASGLASARRVGFATWFPRTLNCPHSASGSPSPPGQKQRSAKCQLSVAVAEVLVWDTAWAFGSYNGSSVQEKTRKLGPLA